ncbi:MAG: FlgD immunoglobulin-like domain containing protein [Spirochaetales bacterium]|nr:FlgD immunoglobulin-like domain containing protein [Spirochaetales bacterium]
MSLGDVTMTADTTLLSGTGTIDVTSISDGAGSFTLSLQDAAATGAVSFAGAVTVAGVTTFGGAYDVSFNGGGTIDTATTFSNGGVLTLGDDNADLLTFTAGVIATAPSSKNVAGTLAAAGSGVINLGTTSVAVTDDAVIGGASTGQITLFNTVIANGATLTLGAGAATPVTVTTSNGSVDGTSDLTINTSGAVSITGNVGNNFDLGTITVTNSGGTTFGGTVDADNIVITDTATGQTISFTDDTTVNTGMSAAGTANDYNISFTGATNSIAGASLIENTGTLTLGDADTDSITFIGGLDATTQSGINTAGTVAATNAAIDLADVTMTADTTLVAGTGTIDAVSVTDGTGSFNLSLQDAAASGAVSFAGTVTVNTLTTFLGGTYPISFNGGGTIDTATTFRSTGVLTLGDDSADILTFTAGVIATAPTSKNVAGTLAAAGSGVINLGTTPVAVTDDALIGGASTGQITLFNTVIADGVSLTLGAGAATPVAVTTINGSVNGTSDLTINTSGTVSITGNVGNTFDLGTITVTNSGGTTFGGTVDTDSVVITDSAAAQTISFTGNTTVNTGMSAAAGNAYNISFTGTSNSIAGSTTLANSGTLTLGDALTDSILFSGGLDASAASQIDISGTVNSTDSPLTFSNIVINTAVTISSVSGSGGNIIVNGTIDADASTRDLVIASGTADVTLSGVIGGGTALRDLTITSADNISISSLGDAGNEGLAGDLDLDAVTDITLTGAYYRTIGDQSYTTGGYSTWAHSGSGDFESGSASIVFNEVYMDLPLITVRLLTDIQADKFVGYRGTLDLRGSEISTTGDFAIFGGAFSEDDPDWSGADTRFEYPGTLSLARPGTPSTVLTTTGGVPTITVGGSFYVNGANLLTSTTAWNLNVQDNNSPAGLAYNSGTGTTSWGSTYNLVFNSTVSNSTVAGGIIAASEPDGVSHTNNNVTANVGNNAYTSTVLDNGVGWNFDTFAVNDAYTVWDNVIYIEFTQPVENSNNEINAALGTASAMYAYDGSTNTVLFDGAYTTFDPATGAVSNSTDGQGDLTSFYIQLDPLSTDAWNTDAETTSITAGSTDSAGVFQNQSVVLNMIKSHFFSAGGAVPIINYGENAMPRYEAVTDQCPPFLVGVKAGITAHGGAPASYAHNDAHNYFIFRYSEAVEFFDNGSNNTSVTIPTGNTRANAIDMDGGGTYLGHMENNLATVTVNGIMTYPGVFYSGTIDGTAQVNSFEDRGGTYTYELQVNIAGYSTPAGTALTSRDWPGYLGASTHALTDPDGLAFTGLASGNVRDVNNFTVVQNTGLIINDPLTNVTGWDTGDMPTGWDVDPPAVSLYKNTTVPNTVLEVIPLDSTSDSYYDRVEFHIMDDGSTFWDTETDHPDGTKGIRDSSLRDIAAFLFEIRDSSPLLPDYNDSFVTGVINSTFNSGSFIDDPYFSILLDSAPWDTLTKMWFEYQEDVGYLTDLAGNRLLDVNEYAVEYVPPEISLTLAVPGDNKIYVQFSEAVYGDDTHSSDIDAGDVFYTGGPLSITSVTILDAPDNTEFYFHLDGDLTRNDIFSGRINVNPLSIYDYEGNVYRDNFVRRISDLGIDVVEPIWASDGIHSDDISSGSTLKDFDGTGRLLDRNITIQARVNASVVAGSSMRIYYDANVPSSLLNNGFWLPIYHPVLAPTGNFQARYLNADEVLSNGLQNFVLLSSDSEVQSGNTIEFMFYIDNLPCVRLADPSDLWSFEPYSFKIDDIREQKGGVTILNNVINPNNGDKAVLMYDIPNAGVVTAQIFTLNGNLVKILQRGRQAAGTYQYVWDGRNNAGNIVARGVYFVRVVGPDTDEIRKIMVVK